MSHFYGTLEGNRGEVTRCGSKASGITSYAAGWRGAIRVDVFERDGEDRFQVTLVPWQNSGGIHQVIAEGVLNANKVRRS